MNDFPPVTLDIVQHQIEIYTSRYIVKGAVSGPFRRVSDMLNRKDDRFLTVENPFLSYVGQDTAPQEMDRPLSLARASIQFVVAETQMPTPKPGGVDPMLMRDQYIAKNTHPCTTLTDLFIIRGYCHLRDGFPLQQFLEMGDPFIPITEATIALTAQPEITWQRGLIIVNKDKIETIYQED